MKGIQILPLMVVLFLSSATLVTGQDIKTTYFDEEESMVKEKYETRDGLPHGEYQRFDERGVLVQTGNFKDGKKEGPFVEYYPGTKDTLKVTVFDNNTIAEPVVSYFENGNIAQKAPVSEGEINGLLESFYESGRIKSQTEFKSGKPNGMHSLFSENGEKIETSNFTEGILDGVERKFHENGNVSMGRHYEDGSVYGIQKTYFADGQIASEIAFKEGVKHGEFITYHENGQIDTQGNYRRGQPHGTFVSFFEGGERAEVASYKRGEPKGEIVKYFSSGNLQEKTVHDKNGLVVAKIEYHENGEMLKKTEFLQRTVHGETKIYFPDGSIHEIIPYRYGVPDGTYLKYDEEGKVVEEKKFNNGKLLPAKQVK